MLRLSIKLLPRLVENNIMIMITGGMINKTNRGGRPMVFV
jgi:hypothetical protein